MPAAADRARQQESFLSTKPSARQFLSRPSAPVHRSAGNISTKPHSGAVAPNVPPLRVSHGQPRKRSASSASPRGTSPIRKTARPSTSTLQIQSDRLGTLVSSLCESFTASSSWQDFVDTFRGRSYLSPDVSRVDHPAAPLLDKWRLEGVPVLSSAEPWSLEELDARLERGCHPSACEHASFLREEFAEFIERSFWAVLPYRLVRTLPNLQLSPAAVKDERDRKPRLLCDHSWYPVNDTTLTHAPLEAMQFGGALPRVLRAVRHANPRYGPTRLAKHDIKDGFYRMFLRARDCLRLGIVLPRYADEEPLVAIPMSCTMGWTMSPPTFSVMSETVTDLANAKFAASPRQAVPHRLSSIAEEGDELHQDFRPVDREPDDLKATNSLRRVVGLPELRKPPRESDAVPISNNAHTRPLGLTDVFVDDFIQIGQGGRDRMAALRDHLLHAVDEVLSQPTPDEKHRAEAISLKKLLQGDGSWSTRKLILGWILDTVRQTIELPPHRKETLAKIFEDLKTRRRVSKKTWSSILGKLRFVAIAIPGSAGLFSALQLALNRAEHNRIKVTRHLKRHIHAFAALAADVCSRPTYLPELVAERPAVIGATDAARQGMGGVFFDHEERPFVWRYCFTPHVQSKLITFRHRDGSITNSDLEQAGVIAQLGLISDTLPVRYATIDILTDNTPAVSRFRKGSVSSDSPASYLCREASLQQRAERYHAHISADQALEAASAPARALFKADLSAAMQLVGAAKTSKTTTDRQRIFALWEAFCASLHVSCTLREVDGTEAKLCYLLVFAHRYRGHGRRGQPVRAGGVQQALLAVGEGFTHLGEPDPRRDPRQPGRNHPILTSFLKKLRDDDDPAQRAYPVTVDMLRQLPEVLDTRHPQDGRLNQHAIDLCIVAFYWLMRPGEYTGFSSRNEDASRSSRSEAFRLQDVTFTIKGRQWPAPTVSLNDVNLLDASYASLRFSDQKNAVRGEEIGHWHTTDPVLCPCKALARLVTHLLHHGAPPDTPICTFYYRRGKTGQVTSAHITNALRHAAAHIQTRTGIDPAHVSARSLRPGGATALLCANVDSRSIQLLGRWKSDAMLHYLRIYAQSVTERFSQRMLTHGNYTFDPSTLASAPGDALPREAPAAIVAAATTPFGPTLTHAELYES